MTTTATKTGTDQYVKDNKKAETPTVQITDAQIARQFNDLPPTAEQAQKIARVRDAALVFCQIIKDNTNNSPDQAAAIRYVRLANMVAKDCIMLKGK